MTWDDDRKAAAFVTSTDPDVLLFAKNTASDAGSKANPPAINATFRIAMALFQAMNLQGVSYVTDPTTPYESSSKNKTALDFLQFPMQTLAYRAGDCDDLSILYAALLEAAGIRTAFITVPGHIYVAFDLGHAEGGRESHLRQPRRRDLPRERHGGVAAHRDHPRAEGLHRGVEGRGRGLADQQRQGSSEVPRSCSDA